MVGALALGCSYCIEHSTLLNSAVKIHFLFLKIWVLTLVRPAIFERGTSEREWMMPPKMADQMDALKGRVVSIEGKLQLALGEFCETMLVELAKIMEHQ